MASATIRFTVDLVIQIIDATTGLSVGNVGVEIKKNGNPFETVYRGNGTYMAINVGREDFTLGIKAYGYEDTTVSVEYEKMDEKMPIRLIHLVPKENIGTGEPVLSLSGSLEGIESIEGVCIDRQYCAISDFDERKRIMTVFRPQGILSMDDVFYGIINKNLDSYEKIEVTKVTGPMQVKLSKPLENEFQINDPIAKIIFGQVKGNEYCFRIRDNSTKLNYLVCYVVRGEKHFKLFDFKKPEELSLS